MSRNVPATAFSSNVYQTVSRLAVGGTQLQAQPTAGYWYVVVDLTDGLKVVANEFSNGHHEPPAKVAAMLGNPNYFLFFIAQAPLTASIPQGDLATFLRDAGSGVELTAIEQTVGQLGSGAFATFSYVLAATLNEMDLPGFEAQSMFGPCVLNMQFIPLDVDGRTVYAPVQLGAPSPSPVRAVHTPLAAG